MRARIVPVTGGCYVGEVYGTWANWLLETKWTGWNKVTSRCMTKLGARLELETWKRKNYPEEFEL